MAAQCDRKSRQRPFVFKADLLGKQTLKIGDPLFRVTLSNHQQKVVTRFEPNKPADVIDLEFLGVHASSTSDGGRVALGVQATGELGYGARWGDDPDDYKFGRLLWLYGSQTRYGVRSIFYTGSADSEKGTVDVVVLPFNAVPDLMRPPVAPPEIQDLDEKWAKAVGSFLGAGSVCDWVRRRPVPPGFKRVTDQTNDWKQLKTALVRHKTAAVLKTKSGLALGPLLDAFLKKAATVFTALTHAADRDAHFLRPTCDNLYFEEHLIGNSPGEGRLQLQTLSGSGTALLAPADVHTPLSTVTVRQPRHPPTCVGTRADGRAGVLMYKNPGAGGQMYSLNTRVSGHDNSDIDEAVVFGVAMSSSASFPTSSLCVSTSVVTDGLVRLNCVFRRVPGLYMPVIRESTTGGPVPGMVLYSAIADQEGVPLCLNKGCGQQCKQPVLFAVNHRGLSHFLKQVWEQVDAQLQVQLRANLKAQGDHDWPRVVHDIVAAARNKTLPVLFEKDSLLSDSLYRRCLFGSVVRMLADMPEIDSLDPQSAEYEAGRVLKMILEALVQDHPPEQFVDDLFCNDLMRWLRQRRVGVVRAVDRSGYAPSVGARQTRVSVCVQLRIDG